VNQTPLLHPDRLSPDEATRARRTQGMLLKTTLTEYSFQSGKIRIGRVDDQSGAHFGSPKLE